MCGYERGVLLLGLFPPKTQTEKTEGTPLPTISAGVPRIEKDPHGGDVVIVPVRPYAKDMDRCTRCGKHVRPYDRLGVRRWRHLDIGCARLMLEYAPPRVTCADHGVTVAMMPWARRKSTYTRDFEQLTALLNVHAPRSAVSRLMRMDWKSVGPVCRRVADDLRAEQGPGLFDGPRSIGVDETSYRKGHKYMTVVVDHDRGRVIWMHQGHGQKVFDELVKLFVYGTYLRLLLFSWVRSWVVVVGCRVHRIGA